MSENKIWFKIISIIKVPSRDPLRIGELDYIIMVQFSDGTPITIRIPETQYNEETIKELIKKEYEKIKALTGKVYEL